VVESLKFLAVDVPLKLVLIHNVHQFFGACLNSLLQFVLAFFQGNFGRLCCQDLVKTLHKFAVLLKLSFVFFALILESCDLFLYLLAAFI
jgi:hypothetical protein